MSKMKSRTNSKNLWPDLEYLDKRRFPYSVRVQVPADLRVEIGKSEFKQSLGSDPVVGRQKYHQLVAKFQGIIREARNRTVKPLVNNTHPNSKPSREDIELACHSHFRRMLLSMRGKVAEPVGETPGLRVSRIEGYEMMIEHHLHINDTEDWGVMAILARWLCEENGWRLAEGDELFVFLCETLLGARLQCYRNELRMLEGLRGPDPNADPLFGPRPPKRQIEERKLGDLIDKFNKTREKKWSASTRKNYIIITRVLEEICGRDTLVADIDSDFCHNVCDILLKLPANYQKLPATRGKLLNEAIEIGQIKKLATISPATIKSHLNKLGAIVRFGRDQGWIIGNPMADVDVDDPIHPEDKRDPFSTPQLTALFSTDPWLDHPPSSSSKYPSRYWAPLVALYTGARLTDICGQRIDEMIEEDGIKVMHIVHRPGNRETKNKRNRKVPIHSQLAALGFWDFVEDARRQKREFLFSDVRRDKNGKWGDSTSKWFSRKVKKLDLVGRKLSFHSFRHTFEDALRRAELHDTPIGNAITGRWSAGVSKTYGTKYSIEQLKSAVEKVNYHDFDIPTR